MRRHERLADLQGLVGEPLGTSDWVRMTQERNDQFALATGDSQWIHVDPVRAAAGPFGTTVAHGYLTLSLLPQLQASAFVVADTRMGINYGLDRLRFPAPVPAGSRLRGHFKLAHFESLAGGAQLALEVTMEIEGVAKPACAALALVRLFT